MTLRNKADKLFSLKVREIGYCRRCGQTTGLQCAHICSRRYLSTRWDLDNAMCLDSGCHIYFTHHPIEWDLFVISCIGEEKYNALKKRALIIKDYIDYEEIIRRLNS